MLVGRIFKTDTRNAFVIIKVIILVYAALNIYSYIATYFSAAEMDIFKGSTFAYYLMLVPNTILPLLLLFKKLGRNTYLLLALSFLMNIGWMFELLVIYSIDKNRDYAPNHLSFSFLWLILLQGAFVGSVIFAIGRAFKHKTLDIDTQIS